MFIKTGEEFQSLKAYGRNSNEYKNRARIPMFESKGPEYQGFKEDDRRIPMFEMTGPEL